MDMQSTKKCYFITGGEEELSDAVLERVTTVVKEKSGSGIR